MIAIFNSSFKIEKKTDNDNQRKMILLFCLNFKGKFHRILQDILNFKEYDQNQLLAFDFT